MAAQPFPSVILTKVRIQGYGVLSCWALGPDFRQDDGLRLPARAGTVPAGNPRAKDKRIAPA